MTRIFTSWFVHPDPARAAEIEKAVTINAGQFETWCVCPSANPRPWGTFWVPGPERPTFRELFALATSLSLPGDVVVILNADISVGPSLNLAEQHLGENDAWALSRWNKDNRGRYKQSAQADSQDAWVFRSPIQDIEALDFPMGVPGCDNRLAFELHHAGYNVTNPCSSVATFHHHDDHQRSYSGRVPPPYRSVRASALPGAPSPATVPPGEPGARFRNVLHVALITGESPQRALRNALSGLGATYTEVDWMKDRKRVVENTLASLQDDTDLVFMQLQSAEPINAEGAKRIREATKAKIVSWSGDVRAPLPRHFVDNGRFWDKTLMSNMTDVDLLRVEGVSADYLQIGYDPAIYNRDGAGYNPEGPIVFLGNNYGSMFPLSQHRANMVRILKRAFGNRVQIYGTNWNGVGTPCPPAKEAHVYREAAVAIQQSHFLRPRYYSDRMLRAMACGPLVLTHAIPDLHLEFEAGKHLDVWTNLDDMVERIRFYLANPDKAAAIARAGAQHVASFHTWDARMNDLLRVIP